VKSIPVVENPIGELHCRDRLTLAAITGERPFEPGSGSRSTPLALAYDVSVAPPCYLNGHQRQESEVQRE